MTILTRTIQTTTHGRYLVDAPVDNAALPMLVGFHGYGENAARHVEALREIAGADRWRLVAVQALHRFYRSRVDEVVASWMTREDRDEAIADNIEYVSRVVAEVRKDSGDAPLVYAGFSQGTAMAYRAATAGDHPAAALIALGGDLPPEVDLAALARRGTRVLVGRGTGDLWYSDEKHQQDLARLSAMSVQVDPVLFDGGHEWAPSFVDSARAFLASIVANSGGFKDRR